MKTKLNELLEFPCFFTYKVMGIADQKLPDQVVEVVQRYAPGDYAPKVTTSSKNRYHSISITIKAVNIKKIETLYRELANLPLVRVVL